MRVEVAAVLKRKSLEKGLEELVQEGAVQLFRDMRGGSATWMLGAMGPLQFDVMKHRLKGEYGVDLELSPLPFKLARWPQGDFDPEIFRYSERLRVVLDQQGRHAVLAQSTWDLDRALERHEELVLSETAEPALFEGSNQG
jgi:peptide chain release factor 3